MPPCVRVKLSQILSSPCFLDVTNPECYRQPSCRRLVAAAILDSCYHRHEPPGVAGFISQTEVFECVSVIMACYVSGICHLAAGVETAGLQQCGIVSTGLQQCEVLRV
ncbi:uncharacterized protein LOC128126316 [Lactuca sativa]|uniref:uncharacterized protein LOC128126316 n=1 Tax=Lactuca sativa TaxID=4236 RepID=UPI0022B00F2F|nr:uncharacterized protein LOC128126316 [Lactuca sativa]